MDDLISRSALLDDIDVAIVLSGKHEDIMLQRKGAFKVLDRINAAPVVDAVEIEAIRAWLYKIAMNNTNNYLCDACEEIISRLDGLRVFARERKENEADKL